MKPVEGQSRWRVLLKPLRMPVVACLLVSALVFGGVCWIRSLGWLQRLEFIIYDELVRAHMQPNATDDVIKIVGMTNDDLIKYGFPINDDLLGQLLKKIDADEPAVIGLDMYRDLPEPRDASQYPKLKAVLQEHQRIIAITRFGFVDGPPALNEEPDRVSANNLLKDDVDGVYRRGSLILELNQDQPVPTLSFLLAMKYIERIGLDWELVPVAEDPNRPLVRLGKVVIPRLDANAGAYVNLRQFDYSYLINYEKPLNFAKRQVDKRDPLGQEAGEESDPNAPASPAGAVGKKTGTPDTPYDYSFGEILRGDGDYRPGVFKDKVVIVATVMQSIKDSNPTPIHNNFRGVQQHAVMTRQLIDAGVHGVPMRTWWPDWAETLWIAGCTLLGGLVGLWFRSPWKLVPAVLVLMAGIGVGQYFAFGNGVWILSAIPAIGCLFSAALVTSYVVFLERADRRAVQSLFAKHVSKKVASTLMERSDEFLAGGKMQARGFIGTVIFTDLAGFSTASEKLTAEQTFKWLNEYMDVMVEIVERYDGTVNKFIGDAIMGAFGAPFVDQAEERINFDTAQAVRCALQMRVEVPIINARWAANSPDMPPVAMRVGVFTGPLVHGSLGSTDRLEWTVIGDTVNRANRLEAAGKEIKDQLAPEEAECPILIGPETFKRVGHLFETTPVRDMVLKGITERVTVYRVLSEHAKTNQSA